MHTVRTIDNRTRRLEVEERARMICRLLYFILQDRHGIDLSDEAVTIYLPEDIYPARLYGIRAKVIPYDKAWITAESNGSRLVIL